jgi:hypothetical protein
MPVHVGFVVNKVALGQGFLQVISFSTTNIIPPTLDIYISFFYNQLCMFFAIDSMIK